MSILVGKVAPDFIAKTVMPDNSVEQLFNFKNYAKGCKVVLFFYPLDFTFVCPSEIIAFNNRIGEFSNRNTKLLSVSVDSYFVHLAWKNTPYNKGGIGNITFPMVSDINKSIITDYNVLHREGGIALRGTFIIDENFIIRYSSINDLSIGRNIDELLRLIDAIDFCDQNGEVCPAGWNLGDEGIIPSYEGISHYLTSNAEKL